MPLLLVWGYVDSFYASKQISIMKSMKASHTERGKVKGIGVSTNTIRISCGDDQWYSYNCVQKWESLAYNTVLGLMSDFSDKVWNSDFSPKWVRIWYSKMKIS